MNVLVADDHPLYREAVAEQIQRLLPHARVIQSASLDEASMLAESTPQDFGLFLIDFHMPGMSIDALQVLVRRFPGTPVALISGTAQHAEILAAIRSGARGFIPKTATGEYLAHALNLLLAGGTSVPAEILLGGDENAQQSGHDEHLSGALTLLTQREQDVLRGVVRGLSNKEIGRELNLAEVTVKLHLRGVFRKMGARSRADAAVIATKAGFS
jgi:DNA-binding NarL/FixJ family response regulator